MTEVFHRENRGDLDHKLLTVDPFAPEQKVNTHEQNSTSLLLLVTSSVFTVKDNFNFEHDSVKEARQKGKKPWKLIDMKITMKDCSRALLYLSFHLILT